MNRFHSFDMKIELSEDFSTGTSSIAREVLCRVQTTVLLFFFLSPMPGNICLQGKESNVHSLEGMYFETCPKSSSNGGDLTFISGNECNSQIQNFSLKIESDVQTNVLLVICGTYHFVSFANRICSGSGEGAVSTPYSYMVF